MLLEQTNGLSQRSGMLRPPGEVLSLTGTRWTPDTAVTLTEDIIEHVSRASGDPRSCLHQLPRAQAQLLEALEVGCERLQRNSERMEGTVIEANGFGRQILQSEMSALGFRQEDARLSFSIGCDRRRATPTRSVVSRSRTADPELCTTARANAETARSVLDAHVLSESRRGAQLRAEVAGELECSASLYQQWLDFFRLALELTHSEQRHEVEQMLNLLRSRREDLESNAHIGREQARLEQEHNQTAHTISLENRQASLADYVQRKRSDTEAAMAERQMSLNESAEAHRFDLSRARIDLEQRRGDQTFVASLVGLGLRAVAGAT